MGHVSHTLHDLPVLVIAMSTVKLTMTAKEVRRECARRTVRMFLT